MWKILLPIDGSNHSIRALEYALARKQRGDQFSTVILHVQPEIPPSLYLGQEVVDRWKASELKRLDSKQKVKSLKSQLRAEFHVECGEAAKEIVSYAEKAKCQEIIMGTRGLGALKGLFMGSVATKVIQSATVPVTLIK
tara:strand:- start:42 stop:458 length:417 start_codon:yes stop_codon:yes gene_type:complete